MAKNECVWFRNKDTGYVDGVEKGSAAHVRMAGETKTDSDGVPHLVWEQVDAPKVTSQKYESGMEAVVQVPGQLQAELDKQADEKGGKAKPSGPPQQPPTV